MKNSKPVLSILFSVMLSIGFAQTKTINFEHGSWSEIKAKALKENKLIFVDAYTVWCGPCKWMVANVFNKDTVANYYNSNFINAKIDMEKGEGIQFAKQYEVSCYPTNLFINGKGELIHRVSGSMQVADFLKFGETTKVAENCFSYYRTNYETNKGNADFLVKYISMLSATCLKVDNEVSSYFALQKDEELTSKKNWEMIDAYTNNIESREFKYLTANRAKFDKLYTSAAVNTKIENACKGTLFALIGANPVDEVKYKEAKTKITGLNIAGTKRVIFQADSKLAQKKGDWETYAKLAMANVDLYYLNDPNLLNTVAWDFYEHVDNKEAMLKAEKWAKRSSDLQPGYANLDTYAWVLFKNGKKDLSLEVANKAVNKAKEEKYSAGDYKSTTELIEKIGTVK